MDGLSPPAAPLRGSAGNSPARAAVRGLNAGIRVLTILGAGSPRSRRHQGCLLLRPARGSQVAVLSLSPHVASPLCRCVPASSFPAKDTSPLGLELYPYDHI